LTYLAYHSPEMYTGMTHLLEVVVAPVVCQTVEGRGKGVEREGGGVQTVGRHIRFM